jgi:hypothetical protein
MDMPPNTNAKTLTTPSILLQPKFKRLLQLFFIYDHGKGDFCRAFGNADGLSEL